MLTSWPQPEHSTSAIVSLYRPAQRAEVNGPTQTREMVAGVDHVQASASFLVSVFPAPLPRVRQPDAGCKKIGDRWFAALSTRPSGATNSRQFEGTSFRAAEGTGLLTRRACKARERQSS